MNIAVFDQQSNFGGGMRYVTNLLIGIKSNFPKTQVTLFCNKVKLSSTDVLEQLEGNNITVANLHSIQKFEGKISLLNRAIVFIKKKLGVSIKNLETALNEEIEAKSKNFDIAFFPWPFFLKSPKLTCAKVATFHDFNFKYFFGTPIFASNEVEYLETSFIEWMKDTVPAVSTNFIKAELEKFYPNAKPVHVVHLGSFNTYRDVDADEANNFSYKFLFDKPYILCPTHITIHKNIGNVIAAAALINKNEIKFRLVFTGKYSEQITGKSNYLGLQKNIESKNSDVIGLGYVSDFDMNILLKKSTAMLNASLYEAGNGPGVDAWAASIPVIQSNIPSFKEHIEQQGYKAFEFDARNANSIATAINECLNNHQLRQEYIETSLEVSKKYTWANAATAYIKIFEEAIKNHHHGN